MGNDISMVQQPHNIPSNKMTIVDDVHAGEEEVMSAIIFSQHGNVEESLQIVHNINRPVPSQGQILVKVHAYGINPFDVKLLEKSPKGKNAGSLFFLKEVYKVYHLHDA